MNSARLPQGGFIDRTRALRFRFDGRDYVGYAGDTLASALLANGVKVVGRSFKLHRPRGIFGAGAEEPNGLMQVGTGAFSTPNLRATEIELCEGLTARSVNSWPSARFDLGSVLGAVSSFIPAGFYYKTFKWPDWHLFEGLIRKAAGLGKAPKEADLDEYEFRYDSCDVLVVGAGPSGLLAAAIAADAGARVLLFEQDFQMGGYALYGCQDLDGMASQAWASAIIADLRKRPNCRMVTRASVSGYFDANNLAVVERAEPDDRSGDLGAGRRAARMWQVKARLVVLATGSIERPLVFPNNDRPGVLLASALQQYLKRWAVVPGRSAVIATNNDGPYSLAPMLRSAGVKVAAIVDSREVSNEAERAREAGFPVLTCARVIATSGRPALDKVSVRLGDGKVRSIDAQLLAVSGGHNPTVHLHSQSGGKVVWDDALAAFVPQANPQGALAIGACAGDFDLAAALAATSRKMVAALGNLGIAAMDRQVTLAEKPASTPIRPEWDARAAGSAFVDLQNDVTVKDIRLAIREGFSAVEHLKRYTTLGMATDQGKTSNVNGLAILAETTGKTVQETGTTTFRFPYTPVPVGSLAGHRRHDLLAPRKHLPAEQIHERLGASFENYGSWRRPARFPRASETDVEAEHREAAAVRQAVGLIDNSPLGKIEVKGPDAAAFLDRLYANRMSSMKIGRARYGLMLNERGGIVDDGVAARFAEDHFVVGTTSSGADRMHDRMEELLQSDWPELDVAVATATTAWSVPTLSGPLATDLLRAIGTDIDLSAFPHMAVREGLVAGVSARVYRVSYTGEITYELNVPVCSTASVWERILEVGESFGLTQVGLETVLLLRTEKGFLHLGSETDGSTVPDDVGWGHVLRRQDDFLGKRSLSLPENTRADRLQLVGLRIVDGAPSTFLPVGCHVLGREGSDGYVTSSYFSPTLERDVALAMVRSGRSRIGEVVEIRTDRGAVTVRIGDPVSYDPDGRRLA